jgi:hypothetical protein
MPDGSVKYVHAVARVTKRTSGNLEYIRAVTDVTVARRQNETSTQRGLLGRGSAFESWAAGDARQEFVFGPRSAPHVRTRSEDAVTATLRIVFTATGPGLSNGAAGSRKTDFEGDIASFFERPTRYVHSVGHPL